MVEPTRDKDPSGIVSRVVNAYRPPHHVKAQQLATAAWLAQGVRRSAEREVAGSNPGRINTHGLKIAEKKVLPL